MADARKRAEEWLDEYGGEEYLSTSGLLHARETAVDLLRALLAEEPPVGQLVEGEPGHESCVGCGRPVSAEEPGAAKLHFVCTDFPGPKNECVFVECEDGEGHGVNAGEWIRRPDGLVALVVSRRAPLPPEVREAAEMDTK